MSSLAQGPWFSGPQCGVERDRDHRFPETMDEAEAKNNVDGEILESAQRFVIEPQGRGGAVLKGEIFANNTMQSTINGALYLSSTVTLPGSREKTRELWQVTRLRVTKSPGQGLNMSSLAQGPCLFGPQCGVKSDRDHRFPEAMDETEAGNNIKGV